MYRRHQNLNILIFSDATGYCQADGKFHVGDCYILLAIAQTSGHLKYAAHFWIGSESSLDEQGIAAYKTVELDDSIG